MRCPNCQTENETGKFCYNCGSPIDVIAPNPTISSTPIPPLTTNQEDNTPINPNPFSNNQYGGGQPNNNFNNNQFQQPPISGFSNHNDNFNHNANSSSDSNGIAIASLILGILSLFTCYFWYISPIIAILAIVFGAMGSKKQHNKGMAIAGLVMGIISIVLVISVVIWVYALAFSLFGWYSDASFILALF